MSRGTLALVGGGGFSDGCSFDSGLLESSGGREVAFLPTGAAYENPDRLVAAARQWFDGLGAGLVEVPVLTRADAMSAVNVDLVRKARFIYVAGTSAMHLRSVLKDSPVYEAILAAHDDGAVLAGISAGADVLCDPMVDARGGAFTVGLGLVSGVAVIPQSNTWSHDKIHRTVQLAPTGVVVAEVPEATALIRAPDGTWRSEGVGEVHVHIDHELATLTDLTG